MKSHLLIVSIGLLIATGAQAQGEAGAAEVPESPWSGKVTFGFLGTGGNTDTTSMNGAFGVGYKTGNWEHLLAFNAIQASQDNEDETVDVGELSVARQRLSEEQKRLAPYYRRPNEDAVAGIPVDSEYIIFVIDTSGSMLDRSWTLAQRMLQQTLAAYPEVKGVLWDLKEKGIRTAILSNGTERMLWSAVRNAGIHDYLEEVISVEKLEMYKPHPAVYQLAVNELAISAERICFMSSNAWDVAGAANFGFQVIWNVSHALHTPLMAITNAISSVVILGALLQISVGGGFLVTLLAAISVLIASINIVGGFVVTRRMLAMFQKS